ncbi:MAG: hypothetical protein NVSMB48_02510 [Marmoricola sp.]|jgi:hypothetical protein
MAKALLGYMTSADPRQQMRLVAENRHLRQRIADLESALNAAHVENEALAALASRESDSVLEPA